MRHLRVLLASVIVLACGLVVAPAVAAVEAVTPEPPPAIHGTPRTGSTLTVTRGTWPTGWTVSQDSWLRDGTPIDGATGTSYQLTEADFGHDVSVEEDAYQLGDDAVGYRTAAVHVLAGPAPVNTRRPFWAGTRRPGNTITAYHGQWDPMTRVTFGYQWLRNGSLISGARYRTYRLTRADVGKNVSVRVQAVRSGYTTGVATSKAYVIWKAG